MLDSSTRLILAAIMGGGAALGISYFFGNWQVWTFICLAIAFATETSLRTIKNVKAPPSPLAGQSNPPNNEKMSLPKPPKPRF